MRAAAKSPIEIESRLRTGEVLRSRRYEAHTSRVRAPGRACVRRHRFDRDRIPMPRHQACRPMLWEESTLGRRLFPKPVGGISRCWETGTRLDVSVTAAVGAGRSVDG